MNSLLHLGYCALLAALAVLSACSKHVETEKKTLQEKNREQLNQLLKISKTIPYKNDEEVSSGLSLDSGAIVRQMVAKNSGETTSVSYNTDFMEKIKKSEIERYSKQFLKERQEEFKVDVSELIPDQNFITSANGKILTIRYGRSVDGLEVKNAYISLIYAIVGPNLGAKTTIVLRGIRNRSYGILNLNNSKASMPSEDDLQLASGLENFQLVSSKDVVFSMPGKDDFVSYIAREFQIKAEESSEILTITMSRGDKKIVEAYSSRLDLRHQFIALTPDTQEKDSKQTEHPLAFFNVESIEARTDGDGFVDIPEGTDASKINFINARVDMRNYGDAAFFSEAKQLILQGTVEGNRTVFSAKTDIELSALKATQTIQNIDRLVRRHLKPEQAGILKDLILVGINDPEAICSPYFNIQSDVMWLGPEGEADLGGEEGLSYCSSSALLTDVVAHEWCHGLDDKTGQKGIKDRAFSEAIGDICASYLTNSPFMGENLYLDNPVHFRSAQNDTVYPDNVDNTGLHHITGLIVSGSFWDLRTELVKKYGYKLGTFKAEELFFKHLVDTNAYLDSYATLLVLDDDDGNPATQSPDFCIINRTFSRHGLATLEKSCVDRPLPPLGIPSNDDLFFGIERDELAKQLKWVASAKNTAKIEMCFGDPEDCILGEQSKLAFEHVGVRDGRDFFASMAESKPAGLSQITVIATHYYGDKSYHTYATGAK